MMIKAGDLVRTAGSDTLMTVESLETNPFKPPMAWCVWFDKDNKQRRLRYYASDLIRERDGIGDPGALR